MKFQSGDPVDIAHCIALKHEALRCQEAFEDFAKLSTQSIMGGENRTLAFKMYNSYACFVLHLYEFMKGAFVREQHDTSAAKVPNGHRYVEGYIRHHVQRILTNRREAILNGTAPAWENHISAYPEKAPSDFPEAFRDCRNKALGHVMHERTQLSLSEFYDHYHKYLYLLYKDVLGWWLQDENFPDLKEMTDFTVMIWKHPPPTADY